MKRNLKKIIAEKGFAVGSWINTGSPIVAEIMSNSNLDFLTIDLEHSAVDIERSLELFQAIAAGNNNCLPMVRLAGNEYYQTKRYLDAGATGVIAPLVNTKSETHKLVNSAKYPPFGKRGVGYGRSSGYGFKIDEYLETANNDTFVCVQIEHIDAVRNIDEIFSVEGVDAALIGPYDLTASMGITAQWEHPKYKDAWELILKKCDEYKIYAGIHVVQPEPEKAIEMINKGFKIIAYSLDITMLGYYYKHDIEKINRGIK